jgi:hypothetical protein
MVQIAISYYKIIINEEISPILLYNSDSNRIPPYYALNFAYYLSTNHHLTSDFLLLIYRFYSYYIQNPQTPYQVQ